MPNVTVLVYFNKLPVIAIHFNAFADNVQLATEAYFRGVWSKLRTRHGGIEYSKT